MPDRLEGRPAPERDPSMKAILEALLYASPDPVGLEELKEAFGADRAAEVEEALAGLLEEYGAEGRGLAIERVAGGYRIATRPELAGVLREFVKRRNRARLSRAALETLALVAYRQPVTAPEIEAVRGVNPSSILRSLLERRMLRILGRKRVVGKPFLYGTTPEFLEHFGLNSLDDLPSLEEFAGLLGEAPVPAQDEPVPGGADREGEGEREGAPPAAGLEIET